MSNTRRSKRLASYKNAAITVRRLDGTTVETVTPNEMRRRGSEQPKVTPPDKAKT